MAEEMKWNSATLSHIGRYIRQEQTGICCNSYKFCLLSTFFFLLDSCVSNNLKYNIYAFRKARITHGDSWCFLKRLSNWNTQVYFKNQPNFYADFIYYNVTLHNYVVYIICTVSVKLYLHYFSERFPLFFSISSLTVH